ncbi:MAG: glycosyltransferase family 4 protein [Roseobacter sp.]
MRVLIVSQYFWPETFQINRQAVLLSQAGVDVTVLTGQPNYPSGKVADGYRAWHVTRSKYHGIDVMRVPLFPRGASGAVRLILNYVSFVFSAALFGPWLLRREKYDVVFVYAPSPILQTLPAILIARLKRAGLVLWVQDLWPEALEATGFSKNERLLNGIGKMVGWIYRRCDRILIQSDGFRASVSDLSGTPDKVHLLHNPAHSEDAAADVCDPKTQALVAKINAGFTVLFAGNFGRAQGLDTILEAAEHLRGHADIQVALVGSGRMSGWVQQEVSRRKLGNVLLPGRLPPDQMPMVYKSASLLLVSLAKNAALSHTIPSKVQTYLSMGRPIIGSIDGAAARIIDASKAGISVPAGDAAALSTAILDVYALSPEERQEMGENTKSYFKLNFSSELITQKLIEHLKSAKRDGSQA